MRVLSIDQHIAVSADIRHIFNTLGHTVREISLSGHAAVINRPQGHIPELEGDNWCHVVRERKTKEFYETYKDAFKDYDAFLCCYPPAFSLLWEYFDKPIIIQIPIRYENGFDCDPENWTKFNEYLRVGVDSGKIILCANSLYDKRYAEGFIEREVKYIPSLCEYTGMNYNPVYDQFLYYASFDIKDPSGRMIKKHDALKAGHAWQTVADFKGAIHYPYNTSTMTIFEQYAAGMPVFFPTKRYLLEMFLAGVPVLNHISWQCHFKKAVHSLIPHKHEFDPNNYLDFNVVSHWLDSADFYAGDMKHIQYFDNAEERHEILGYSLDKLQDISRLIRQDHSERRVRVHKAWAEVIEGIL